MNIRVLFFAGCPNHDATVALIRDVADALGSDVEIDEVEVKGPEDARRLRFLGSPTVQVDGVDIEPAHRGPVESMSCRLYGRSGIPPRALIEAAFGRRSPS